MPVLADNPLLTLLGRRHRGAVVEVLRRNPGRAWTVRELARFADVPAMAAQRAVRELAALGAAEALRPGRDARVRWLPASAAGRFLAGLEAPDLRLAAAAAFAAAYARRGVRVVWWSQPGDEGPDPSAPCRLALVGRDAAASLEAAGAALDAVRAAGLPAPDVSAWEPSAIQGEDAVARAIREGRLLGRPSGDHPWPASVGPRRPAAVRGTSAAGTRPSGGGNAPRP